MRLIFMNDFISFVVKREEEFIYRRRFGFRNSAYAFLRLPLRSVLCIAMAW